jgi:hypothetical protein
VRSKAFHRLAEKIKKTYPRLPICILGDSFYACEPVFKCCEDYHWKYLFRFKEGRIKSIAAEFNTIKAIEHGKEQDLFWVDEIDYKERMVNLLEAKIQSDDGQSKQFLSFLLQ